MLLILCVSLFLSTLTLAAADDSSIPENVTEYAWSKLKKFLLDMRSSEPIYVGHIFPDELPVVDLNTQIQDGPADVNATFANSTIAGLSRAHVNEFFVDFVKLQGRVNVTYTQLLIRGNYKMEGKMFVKINSSGDFTMNLSNPFVIISGHLRRNEDRKLVSHIPFDVHPEKVKLHFGNLVTRGFFSRFANSFLNVMNKRVFELWKPHLLREYQVIYEGHVNELLKPIDAVFNIVHALLKSLFVAEADSLETMLLPSLEFSKKMIFLKLFGGYIRGLSDLHDKANLSVSYANNTFVVVVGAGFDTLVGGYEWSVDLFGIQYTNGMQIHIKSIRFHVLLSMENCKGCHPKVTITDISLEEIIVKMKGFGLFNHILDSVLSFVGNAVKGFVIYVIEKPIQIIIQKSLALLELPF